MSPGHRIAWRYATGQYHSAIRSAEFWHRTGGLGVSSQQPLLRLGDIELVDDVRTGSLIVLTTGATCRRDMPIGHSTVRAAGREWPICLSLERVLALQTAIFKLGGTGRTEVANEHRDQRGGHDAESIDPGIAHLDKRSWPQVSDQHPAKLTPARPPARVARSQTIADRLVSSLCQAIVVTPLPWVSALGGLEMGSTQAAMGSGLPWCTARASGAH